MVNRLKIEQISLHLKQKIETKPNCPQPENLYNPMAKLSEDL